MPTARDRSRPQGHSPPVESAGLRPPAWIVRPGSPVIHLLSTAIDVSRERDLNHVSLPPAYLRNQLFLPRGLWKTRNRCLVRHHRMIAKSREERPVQGIHALPQSLFRIRNAQVTLVVFEKHRESGSAQLIPLLQCARQSEQKKRRPLAVGSRSPVARSRSHACR